MICFAPRKTHVATVLIGFRKGFSLVSAPIEYGIQKEYRTNRMCTPFHNVHTTYPIHIQYIYTNIFQFGIFQIGIYAQYLQSNYIFISLSFAQCLFGGCLNDSFSLIQVKYNNPIIVIIKSDGFVYGERSKTNGLE